MSRQRQRRPTDAELRILRVLWQRGASTVREVQQELNKSRPTGYTTVLKFLQIMTEKELVVRDESHRSHVYTTKYSEDHTQQLMVRDLLERAFGGSIAKLITQTLSVKKISPEEATEIRHMLSSLSS